MARGRRSPGRSSSRGQDPLSPQGSPAWQHHVSDFGLARSAEWSLPVHPTQIYEALVGLFLFAMLMLIRRYRRFSGQVFLGWVLGYGILRPLIEIVRDDDQRGGIGPLSTSQFIGITSVVLGIGAVRGAAAPLSSRPGRPAAMAQTGGGRRQFARGSGRLETTSQPTLMRVTWARRAAVVAGLAVTFGAGVRARAQSPDAGTAAPRRGRRPGPGRSGRGPARGAGPRGPGDRTAPDAGRARRQRAAFDDIRRRLDELDSRQAETERRQAQGGPGGGEAGEGSTVRFAEDGFFIVSPDRSFLLRPRLRLATVYEGVIADAGSADLADPNFSSFTLTHAEVIFEGHAGGPRFQYRLQIDAAETPQLNDAFAGWRATRSVAVNVGRFKVPYGLRSRTWSGELEFVDFSNATKSFSLERDIGVLVSGRPIAGRLQYDVAVTNGAGPALITNDNIDLAYSARIAAAPFGPLPSSQGDIEWHTRPLLAVGVSGYYNLAPTDIQQRVGLTANPDMDSNGRIDTVAIWQGGVDARALWRGAGVQAEWFGRREDPGVAGMSRQYWGGYAQASYFIIPQILQVAARVGRSDLPLYGAVHRRAGPAWAAGRRADRRHQRLHSRQPDEDSGRLQPSDGPRRDLGARRSPRPGAGPARFLSRGPPFGLTPCSGGISTTSRT